ncbi:hypothetical protein SASPL_133267 [Salvia splendens]|uniref:30S ribosomal protein S9 n=1 Tax=Salvia splendens TaxID=180675 RepID=A0A8X8X0Z9_SALSN|nr:hypothetical protein SASPL_133267 [Salvia splendens]
MNTIQIPQVLDSETLLEYISKLIAQYKEQHTTTAAGQEPTAGRESAPPATEKKQATAAARREPATVYAGKELTTGKKRQPNRATEGDRERKRVMATPTANEPLQCFDRKKTAVAATHCKRSRDLIKINGKPIELMEPEIL